MTDEGEEKFCPGCNTVVEETWARCPYCLYGLKLSCTACGAYVQEDWLACVQCGVKITKKEPDTIEHNHEHKQENKKVEKEAEFDFNFDNLSTNVSASVAMSKCPTCLAEVQSEWANCPYCHTVLN
jgi:RNA polymerase subunit RPABC4/transcription elongation factor Spt4